MAAVTADAPSAVNRGLRGPVPARTAGPTAADQSPATVRPGPTVQSWALLVLAVPAAAEVWSGWVGIAQKTGFGLVSPLPGIWPSLHLDTSITLPVGVEAYAAYALRAWLASEHAVSARTRRFAKWSAIFSFALGMAGQVAYHLMAQAGMARAPWPITTVVSCLPVLVLAMGTALAHMLRADAAASWSAAWSPELSGDEQDGPDQDHAPVGGFGLQDPITRSALEKPVVDVRTTARRSSGARTDEDQARLVARRLAAAGKPLSRRALRGVGVTGSSLILSFGVSQDCDLRHRVEDGVLDAMAAA